MRDRRVFSSSHLAFLPPLHCCAVYPPLSLLHAFFCFWLSLLDTMATSTAYRTDSASLDGAPIEPSNIRAGGRRRGGRKVRREANRTGTDTNQDSSDQGRADQGRADHSADGRSGTGTTQEEADVTRADGDGPYLDRADVDPPRAEEDHPRADEDLGRADGPVADARMRADVDRRADRRAEDDLRMADARTQDQDRMLTARKRKADAEDEDDVPMAKRIKIEDTVDAGASTTPDEDPEDWYDEDEGDEDERDDEEGKKDAFEDMVKLLGRGVTEEEASQRMRDAGNAEQAATWLDATALSEMVSWALTPDMEGQGAFTTWTNSHDGSLRDSLQMFKVLLRKQRRFQHRRPTCQGRLNMRMWTWRRHWNTFTWTTPTSNQCPKTIPPPSPTTCPSIVPMNNVSTTTGNKIWTKSSHGKESS